MVMSEHNALRCPELNEYSITTKTAARIDVELLGNALSAAVLAKFIAAAGQTELLSRGRVLKCGRHKSWLFQGIQS